MTLATLQKRRALLDFIQRVLEPEPAVQAVIGIGSIATSTARPGSDIDALVLFEPSDLYIVPAEFIWLPGDGSFHSIFSRELGVQEIGIQFDFARRSLAEWSDPRRVWLDGERAELSEGWLAFDRHGGVAPLMAERATYSDHLRQARLDDALIWLDQHLKWGEPSDLWTTFSCASAHDRLHAAYDYLAQALFAYNRCWRAWRNREMSYLLRLPWLPEQFADRVLTALNAPSHEYAGYLTRFEMLRALFGELLVRLVADGDYGQDDPVSEAFTRRNNEPGRAWNMAEWNQQHTQRRQDSERGIK